MHQTFAPAKQYNDCGFLHKPTLLRTITNNYSQVFFYTKKLCSSMTEDCYIVRVLKKQETHSIVKYSVAHVLPVRTSLFMHGLLYWFHYLQRNTHGVWDAHFCIGMCNSDLNNHMLVHMQLWFHIIIWVIRDLVTKLNMIHSTAYRSRMA